MASIQMDTKFNGRTTAVTTITFGTTALARSLSEETLGALALADIANYTLSTWEVIDVDNSLDGDETVTKVSATLVA